jgi:catechol 2,3-dioxygenase-like lactoylglutathione lyase family enzyme
MLGHISLGVRDLQKAAAFYDAAMSALGYARTDSSDRSIGYGPPGGNDGFRLIEAVGAAPPGAGFHLAFGAPSQLAVDRFHEAALRHGGTDNGGPGLRPVYGPNYDAAFVLDPDGYRLEAKHPPPPEG